uniref:Hemoglobinase n=2 Tax=Macrostomum lignano TaxID=282301 RepID=A0A1I8GLU7_9PLAT
MHRSLAAVLLICLAAAASSSAEDLKWVPIMPSRPLLPEPGSPDAAKHWVVLVAGSNTWSNYRHQADVCHAYQIVKKHGVPENQIITMMYDDIAHNVENPTKGIVINKPGGSDVYGGVKIDYKGKKVTPENFLNVLQGKGSGKVLKSGPDDIVFINFVDHGAPGLIAFPHGVLKAKPLIDALQYMHQNKMYKKLVFYLEACESGSMFEKLLPPGISIYATTAANPDESSYACYYDKKRETYLGDVYSVNWMEDTDANDINQESLDQQFAVVKSKTNTSHVMKYGDTSLGSDKVGEFQGSLAGVRAVQSETSPNSDAVSQRDVKLTVLQKRLASAKTEQDRVILSFLIRELETKNAKIAQVFDDIVRKSLTDPRLARYLRMIRFRLNNFDCHHSVVDEINERCFNLGQTEEALRHVYKVVNLCESRVPTDRIVAAVREVCGDNFRL